MNKAVVMTQIEMPRLGKDTRVEVEPDGELVLFNGAPEAPTTLGELSDKATQAYKECVFEPKKRRELFQAVGTLQRIVDAQLGVSDTLPVVGNPSNAVHVVPAAHSLITHQSTVKKVAPVAWEQVNWATLESDVDWLEQVTKEKEQLQVRVQNFEILEAHLRQRVYQPMANLYSLGKSAIDVHRSLGADLEPVTDLFTGASQKAQETKKEVARALKKKAEARAEAAHVVVTPPVVVAPPVIK